MFKCLKILIGFTIVFYSLLSAQNKDKTNILLSVNTDLNKIIIEKEGLILLSLDSLCFDFNSQDKIEIISKKDDTWKLKLTYNNVSGRDIVNEYKDRVAELIITREGNRFKFEAEVDWAKTTTLHLADLGGHFFGVSEPVYPTHTFNPDLRGEVLQVVLKAEHDRYFENCAAVWSAFYFNTKGYASFYDTFAEGEYKFGINGNTRLFHHTAKLDWYVIVGENGNAIFSQYYDVIGVPKFVPDWACGPIIWRDDNKGGKDEVLDDTRRFTEMKIPFTTLLVDRPYSNGAHKWSKMDFNELFAEPEVWIKTLNDKYGLEFITWIASATFGDQDFPAIFPGWFGYFDLTNQEAIDEFDRRLRKQYDLGVKGHKLDRADEYFPVGEKWVDETPMQYRLNKYGFLYSKVTDQILNGYWGKDNYNVARAAFHGSQQYLSAVWGGDMRSSWDGMAANLANALRCSYMGFPNWGSNVGGYKGETGRIPEDLYIRWLQWCVWSGNYQIKIDANGGRNEDRPPWKYGEILQNGFRKACEQRMELIPYIYSHLNTAGSNGVLMKPLPMEYCTDENIYGVWDEYLFGHSFLVAPILSPKNERSVYFPEGEWISYSDPSNVYSGKSKEIIKTDINSIPVFVKANSIFVTGQTILGNSKNWITNDNNLVVNVYVGSEQASSSFEFVDEGDGDKIKKLTMTNNDSKIEIKCDPLSLKSILKIYTMKEPKKINLNGTTISYKYENKFVEGIEIITGSINNLVITF